MVSMTSSFSDPEDIDEADFVAFFVLADRVMERDAFFVLFKACKCMRISLFITKGGAQISYH